jgi:hypothetical protein
VFYDYFKDNRARIASGQTAQRLDINEYALKINGIEKHLTLVGEWHDYNKKEYETAKALIKQYKNIASEPGFSWKGYSMKNKLFLIRSLIPRKIVYFYQHLGNGRWYASISRTAVKQGRKVYELEPPNEPLDLFQDDFRNCLFREYVQGAFSLKGPSDKYKLAKGTDIGYASLAKQIKIKQGPYIPKGMGIPKRDEVMAENIIALLEKNGVDSLLATAGNGHIPGILKHLSEKAQVTKTE